MNGETAQLCALTASARIALKNSAELRYETEKYINSEKFVFLRQNTESVENSAEAWFAGLRASGLNDIFMLLPTSARGREVHGYSNSVGGCVLCFYDVKEPSYFVPRWSFDRTKSVWNIEFYESEWDTPLDAKPIFGDNTEEFGAALSEIAAFADRIEQGMWAKLFRCAKEILDGRRGCDPVNIADFPESNMRTYAAAAKADVFGAMGSWNDSPPWYAEQKGLIDEYNRLSDALFSEIQRALLFAVNTV